MLAHRDRARDEWTDSDWQEWVREGERMYHLALDNPQFLRLEMWREEHQRRRAEYEKMLADNGVVN